MKFTIAWLSGLLAASVLAQSSQWRTLPEEIEARKYARPPRIQAHLAKWLNLGLAVREDGTIVGDLGLEPTRLPDVCSAVINCAWKRATLRFYARPTREQIFHLDRWDGTRGSTFFRMEVERDLNRGVYSLESLAQWHGVTITELEFLVQCNADGLAVRAGLSRSVKHTKHGGTLVEKASSDIDASNGAQLSQLAAAQFAKGNGERAGQLLQAGLNRACQMPHRLKDSAQWQEASLGLTQRTTYMVGSWSFQNATAPLEYSGVFNVPLSGGSGVQVRATVPRRDCDRDTFQILFKATQPNADFDSELMTDRSWKDTENLTSVYIAQILCMKNKVE